MTSAFERLGALDSFFLDCESDTNPMHIGAVCIFEAGRAGSRPLSISRLRRHVESRLNSIPRYRQCIKRVPVEGHPVWVDAENFRIEDHVRALALPAPQSCARLEETVSWIFSQPLTRVRPLWEMWLIEGLEDGAVALACKVHHCMADGLGGASLMCAILGTEPFAETGTAEPWTPRRCPGEVELMGSAIAARVRGAASLARRASTQLATSPSEVLDEGARMGTALRALAEAALSPSVETPFDGDPGASHRFLWWSAPIEEIKGIGRRLGGTVNDVALALVSEAFAQTTTGVPRDAALRVFCPVAASQAASSQTLGNRVAGMLIDLPVGERSIRARWKSVLAATRKGKDSGAIQGTFLIEEFANAVAPSLLSTLERAFRNVGAFNLVVTNVPGPPMPLYLFGHKMVGVFPLVPLFAHQSLGIAIFSYDGTLFWGFHADATRIDAVRQLRHALAVALERLSLLAEIPLPQDARRPIPLRADANAWPQAAQKEPATRRADDAAGMSVASAAVS
ncbi:MAG: wax ester/triacylglycerol synthase family O-acyltransferase [Deltaproteobacteria bacterium]|nr:wax ester/triacylglycerol synthase family O-acyltransferase [Deltaproteobacteria bacterium]